MIEIRTKFVTFVSSLGWGGGVGGAAGLSFALFAGYQQHTPVGRFLPFSSALIAFCKSIPVNFAEMLELFPCFELV